MAHSLAGYEYDIHYRPGAKHEPAAGVSSLRTDDGDAVPLDDKVLCFAFQTCDNAPPNQPSALEG